MELISIIIVLIVVFSGLFCGALLSLVVNKINTTDRVILMEMTKNIPFIHKYICKVQYKQVQARALPLYRQINKSQQEHRQAAAVLVLKYRAQTFDMPTMKA